MAKPPKTKTVAAEAVAETKASKAKAPPAAATAAPAKEAKAPKQEVIPQIKSTALSLDVGPRVVQIMGAFTMQERQAKELVASGEIKRREGLVITTQAIVKAAKADKSIRLEDVTSKSEQVKDNLLGQLWIALGFKHVIQVGEGDKQRPKIVWVPEAAEVVHPTKEDPETIKKQKSSVRTNLSTMLKKAAQAALFIVENDVKTEVDKKTGQMLISGPAVRDAFGQTSVVLNENQTVQVTNAKGVATGESVKLKEKPSFQALATKAAEAHGNVVAPRVDSRKEVVSDPAKEIVAMSTRFVAILAGLKKLGKVNEDVEKALESVYNAIDEVL